MCKRTSFNNLEVEQKNVKYTDVIIENLPAIYLTTYKQTKKEK